MALAATDRRIAATLEQWDADPWLLNTPGGVVDLRTGQSRPHSADDYMTKIAGGARLVTAVALLTASKDKVDLLLGPWRTPHHRSPDARAPGELADQPNPWGGGQYASP